MTAPATPPDPLDSLQGEIDSAYLYRLIAAWESDPRKRRLFEELAKDAESQGAHWQRLLEPRTAAVCAPSARARLVGALVRLLGPQRLSHALVALKVRGMSVYRAGGSASAPLPSAHDEVGERHAPMHRGGSLRAAVFGVNDGLVSNASLILGVAGAGTDSATVLLAGVAGLLAGSFSMATGEYVSVRSQSEMYEHQIALEKAELEQYPEEEAGELALIFEARGMAADEARVQAARLVADPQRALDTLSREELGLDPGNLGSPWGAAVWSFLSFACGSVIPLLPFLLASGERALAASALGAGAALFLVGATTSLFTGRSALAAGTRMLALGAAAGALTYGIGNLLGVSLG